MPQLAADRQVLPELLLPLVGSRNYGNKLGGNEVKGARLKAELKRSGYRAAPPVDGDGVGCVIEESVQRGVLVADVEQG